jgi:3-hydroxyisobutyrate dehydrogenase-like beta-hydroxyacid dehydrogenase
MDLKGKKMIQGDFTPESRLGASVDGCALLLEQGRQLGAPLFLTSVYAQIAQAGVHMGFGDADPASLIEVLRMMAGLARRG